MNCNRCKNPVFEDNCTYLNLMIYHKECAGKELSDELKELIPLILKDLRRSDENYRISGSLVSYFNNYFKS